MDVLLSGTVVFDAGCMPDVVDVVVVPVPGGGAFGYVVPLTGAFKLIMLGVESGSIISRFCNGPNSCPPTSGSTTAGGRLNPKAASLSFA